METAADLSWYTDEAISVLNSEGDQVWLNRNKLSSVVIEGAVVSFSISEDYAEEKGIV